MSQDDDPSPLLLEDFLPYRLNRMAELVSRGFSAIYRERYAMTRPEWRALATLGQYGRVTATAIGHHSSMHKTKVSRAVAALEARKWLQRMPDKSDRRIEHLQLTKEGRRVYRDLVPAARAFESKVLSGMDAAGRAAFLKGLRRLEQVCLPGREETHFPERVRRARRPGSP